MTLRKSLTECQVNMDANLEQFTGRHEDTERQRREQSPLPRSSRTSEQVLPWPLRHERQKQDVTSRGWR